MVNHYANNKEVCHLTFFGRKDSPNHKFFAEF